MSFIRISAIAAAVFGLTMNAANAQGGYGALSYFDWSAQEAGLSKIESETVRATGVNADAVSIGVKLSFSGQ